jgi:hypothetical protein
MDASGWDVRRIGGTVRADLARAVHLSAAAADAFLAATEELLRDGEVSIVNVTGPIDEASPPSGLARVFKALQGLVEQRDSQLIVVPI